MSDINARFASLLVNYCIQVNPEDRILIQAHTPAIPMLEHLARAILRADGIPILLLNDNSFIEAVMEEGDEGQFRGVLSLMRFAYESFEGRISVLSDQNTRRVGHIDPESMTDFQRAISSILESQFEREAIGDFKRVTTIYPTNAFAQEAGMGTSEFSRLVFNACHLTESDEDPVEYWQAKGERDTALAEVLTGGSRVTLRSPNCDLAFSIEGMRFVADDGRVNMPGGEIYTSPVKESVNGWIKFSIPVSFGTLLSGVELSFKDGRIEDLKAERGENHLHALIETDEGSKYLGEFGIGTNNGIPKPTGNILLDEKIQGTIHLALGRAYKQTGGTNESGIHLDLITDMSDDSEIEIDGKVIYKDGDFLDI